MYNTRSRARGPQRAQQPPFPPFGRQPPGPGGARGRRGGQDAYLIYSLLSAIYQRLSQLERPVPITCALLAINITAFYIPELFLPFGINFLEIGAICLQPARIVKLMAAPPTVYSSYGGRGMGWDDWLSSFLSFGQTPGGAVSASAATRWQEAASRVWLSAFVHGDQLHIYYNMMSLLYKGASLEMAQGSLPFLALVLFAWLVSHALILVSALALHAFGLDGSYYSCAVGFSAVLFALKYVLNATSDGWVSLQGIPIPVGWACWAELFLTSLISPNASFLGHLCGILAGVLWLDATRVASFLKRTYAALSALVTGTRPGTRYTYMRAPSGRRVPTPSAPPAGAGAAAGASAPPAGHGGNGGVEDELLAEAIRRSLAEQQQSQACAQQAAAVGHDMYRPLAPHVPVATVVSDEAGPRLPSYEEATARNRRRG